MRTIAFDIGYSSIKTDNHKNIPSIVGPARDLSNVPMLGQVSPEENLQIEVHGEQYFVGALAARHSSNPVFSLKKDRYDSEQGMVLMETTIALLANNNEEIRVITGLPVDYQKTQRSNLEQRLRETHAVVFNGQLQRTFVREVKVIPQPMGIFFHHYLDESLNPTDPRWKRQRVGIVDIGYGTTDIAVVDGGQYIDEYSRSSNLAMSRLTRLVSNAVYRDINHRWETHEIDEAIRNGFVRLRGRNISIIEQIAECRRNLSDQLSHWLETEWPDYDKMDMILLGGGGGSALYHHLSKSFHVKLVEDPQQAVVKGYKKLGLLTDRKKPSL